MQAEPRVASLAEILAVQRARDDHACDRDRRLGRLDRAQCPKPARDGVATIRTAGGSVSYDWDSRSGTSMRAGRGSSA